MNIIRSYLALFLVCLACSPAAAVVTPELQEKSIVGVDSETQEVSWTLQHLSVVALDRPDIVKPIALQGTWYYAVRGDLMRLDAENGVVLSRVRYPAMISDLRIKDDALWVRLDTGFEDLGPNQFVDVPAAAEPPAGAWSSFYLAGLRSRADVPDDVKDPELVAKHQGDWSEQRAALRAFEARDPTNPFFPVYRGLAAQRDGDKAAADQAFAKALGTASPWSDWVGVCALLDLANRPADADKACEMAQAELTRVGVDNKDIASLVLFAVVGQGFADAMRDAVEAKDVERADQIGRHMHGLFPNVEAGLMAWHTLAGWTTQQNKPELAAAWTARADAAREHAKIQVMPYESRWADLWILLLICPMLVLPLVGFAAGLRPREVEPKGWRGWLPQLNLLEMAVCLVLMASAVPFAMKAKASVDMIGVAAEMPFATLQGGLASPDVGPWLAGLSDSPEKAALMSHHTAALKAAKTGALPPANPPDSRVVFTAIRKSSNDRAAEGFWSMDSVVPSGNGFVPTNPIPLGLPGLLTFFAFAAAGIVTQRTQPRFAKTLRYVVLGSANPALAVVLNFAFIAGFLRAATPLGSLLQTLAIPAFEKYFGLDALGEFTENAFAYPMDSVWPWAAMVSAVVIHAATLIRQPAGEPRTNP